MWVSRLKTLCKVYLFLASLQFSCFIAEEALQTLMFSSWIQKNPPPATAQAIANAYASILAIGRTLNNGIGWLVPPLYVAYSAYWWSAETWLLSFCSAHGVIPTVDTGLIAVGVLLLGFLILLGLFFLKWPKRLLLGPKGGSWWLKV